MYCIIHKKDKRMDRMESNMEKIFISNIKINKVRHLENIEIKLSDQEAKHLIITGKNGSGKTSLLNSIATFLGSITNSDDPIIEETSAGIMLDLNCSLEDVRQEFQQGHFIVAYYKADRVFRAQVPKHVEKVELKNDYTIDETPRDDFIKYLLDLKMTQALAASNGKEEKAGKIKAWFERFEKLLQTIFEDDFLKLEFDEDTFKFKIIMNGREPFDFNTLSSGFAAVLDIVVDVIIRMEKQITTVFDFSIPGIVLMDEIETHLHLALQKKILGLLTTIFPNVQFIVSTHSPFVINSIENAIIYDLEKHLLVTNGLSNVPYAGIVEGYFDSDTMSNSLKEKFERYKILVNKKELSDDDFEEISELEMYLDEIPDYLALNITTEYQRLKLALRSREDI